MVFTSFQYAAFLPLVLVVYWQLRRVGQNRLLLAASWLFYALFDWRFLGLMIASTCVDYWVGRNVRGRPRVLLASLVVNLGVLGTCKYLDFFLRSGVSLADRLGVDWTAPALKLVLPVGISFYTFHGISYTVDVYRKKVEPASSFLDFACFVAFFPQLVAGPIGRAEIQLPQFERERTRPTIDQVRSACALLLLGVVKKVAIADVCARFVDAAHRDPDRAGWVTLSVGVLAFAVQIYADFSGYSDIARGSSRLLGIELPTNFEQPYLSRNPTELWQRWHISLSRWLRDYLYIPLGGNRGSDVATYRNLLLTMVIGGLWHGAAWTFVVWGLAHGLLLVGHRLLFGGKARTDEPLRLRQVPSIALTFAATAVLFTLFRAATFTAFVDIVRGIVTLRAGRVDADAVVLTLAAALAVLLIDLAQRRTARHEAVLAWPPAVRGLAYGTAVTAVVVCSGGTPVPFVYFQF